MSVKDKTLSILENNKGIYISGENLAKELLVSRNAIWKAIKSLKNDGYNISSVNNKGYCLSPDTDILSSQSISKYLNRDINYFNIKVYKTINSTNSAIKELAINGEKEGTVIIAEEQTEGRGRFGRKFYSPKKTGIYMSILLRPQIHSSKAFLITTATAVAVAEAIESISNKKAKIKWVNDIYCDNKKVCGILTEASFDFESGIIDHALLGIGINVKPPEEGFTEGIKDIATSIFDNKNSASSDIRSRLIAEVLTRFWSYYKNIENKSFLEEYKSRSILINKEINILSKNSSEKAVAIEIDDDCRLKVKMEDGSIRLLSSGEVSIRI
ncbi:biotin--[acetyl-CoA-carboxylase] ligase [Clostridium nigeriense]|uniref:biotin--[acetyl-CoA-carboxylase] ligase n=1 Tax=Clostridium nigeriense TaxID=1805470 RepID=UPI003D326637